MNNRRTVGRRVNDSLFPTMGLQRLETFPPPMARMTLGGIWRFGVVWFILCAVLGLGLTGAVVCVLWHFLSKVW